MKDELFKAGKIIESLSLESLWNNTLSEEIEDGDSSGVLIKDTEYATLTFTPATQGEECDYYSITGEITQSACFDGEKCRIIDVEGNKIKLLCLDADTVDDFFYLSKSELESAWYN